MGIKDLFKLLNEYDLFEPVYQLPEEAFYFVDFNSFFYSSMYFVQTVEDIELFPQKVVDRLGSYLTNNTVFFVDRGDIKPKNDERFLRKSKEIRVIDQLILDNKETYHETIMKQLGVDKILSHSPSDDHDAMASTISESKQPLVIYSDNFDAEYAMVVLGTRVKKQIIYVSNDQDMIALVCSNTPSSIMIYQNQHLPTSSFRLRADEISVVTSQLIVFVTMLCNKSDYFKGFEQITASTFLSIASAPYNFSIKQQSQSPVILASNETLIHNIIDYIKVAKSRSQYRDEDDNFTELTHDYVKRVCMFLSLDTKFFL